MLEHVTDTGSLLTATMLIGDALATAKAVLLIFVGFSLVIFVHQLGHFIMAKLAGVKTMWHYRVIIFMVVLKSIKDYTRFNDFCFLSFQLFYLIGPFILVYTEKYIPESKESKMKRLS